MFTIKKSLKIHIDKLLSLELVCETVLFGLCSTSGLMFLVIFPNPMNTQEQGEGYFLWSDFRFLNLKGMISLPPGLAQMSSEGLSSEHHLSWHTF